MDEVPDTRRLLTAKREGKRRPARPRKNGLVKMNMDTKPLVIKTVVAAGVGGGFWTLGLLKSYSAKMMIMIKMTLRPPR
jgi:hypothetical protein